MANTTSALSAALGDRYRLLGMIGAGGMADVYRARDIRHDRDVAIKVLKRDIAARTGQERFLREISVLSKLNHPSIVPLHDSGASGDVLYFVMPLIEGQSLRRVLDERGPLDLPTVSRLVRQIADALDYAHARGVLHRDIKPENILISDGHARVADFGIAGALDLPDARLTVSGLAIGTPAYMSPEQAAGARDLDRRSDVYSLGVLAREMLVGSQLGAASAARSGLPKAIRAVLSRATAIDRGERTDTAREVSAGLERALESQARRGTRVMLAGAASAAAAMVVVLLWPGGPPAGRMGTHLAVLPFENRTGDPALDQIGSLTADFLAEGLQRAGDVDIVPPSATLELSRRSDSSPVGLATRLRNSTGANTVVSGSFRRVGTGLAFTVNVEDVVQGRLLTTLMIDDVAAADPLPGLGALRGRLMGWLASNLDPRISAHVDATASAPTFAAYVAFMQGMEHYVQGEHALALPLFQSAHARDTTFVTPLLYASLCLTNLGAFASADSLITRLERLRDRLSAHDRDWLEYRAAFLRGDNAGALRAIRRVARAAPGSKAVYNHAVQAFETGYAREALDALQSLDPNEGAMEGFLPYWDLLTSVLHVLDRRSDETESARVGSRLDPDRLVGLLGLVRAFAAAGAEDSLMVVLDGARRLSADPIGWTYGDLLFEAAEELRAHDLPGPHAYYQRAVDWYTANPEAPRAEQNRRLSEFWIHGGEPPPAEVAGTEGERVDAFLIGLQGVAAALNGDRGAAEDRAQELLSDTTAYAFGGPTLQAARIAAALGDTDVTVERVAAAFRQGLPFGLWIHRDGLLRRASSPALDALLESRTPLN